MIPWLALLLLLPAGLGCTTQQSQSRSLGAAETLEPSASGSTAKRFQDTPLEGRTAVESAIELSEKYARLSDQTATLRDENQRLVAENESLLQQIAALEEKLKQTQKELGEANDLLIEMLSELNTWKTNILGFREEMRDAAKAQLEALLKVLEVLGGEAEAGTLSQRHDATLHPEQYDTQPSERSTTSVTGEVNEP
jgi:chromosome segregation ATPase